MLLRKQLNLQRRKKLKNPKPKVKLWHDDIRRPPDDTWIWARTNEEAQLILINSNVTECSLDHDLGLHEDDPDQPMAFTLFGDDPHNNGYKLVLWMIQRRYLPRKITIHSWNPPAAKRMAAALADAGCVPVVKPYEPPS